MDFTPTEAQVDLEGLTRGIAEKIVTPEHLRELDSLATRFDETLWRALADAGVLAATLPESVGGSGFGVLEQVTVLKELGRTLGAVPFLPSIVLAAGALATFGTEAQRELARRAATGSAILTVALVEEGNDEPAEPVTRAGRSGAGWVLTGTKITVPAAESAEAVLVPASTPDGVAVFVVDPRGAGVTVTPQHVVDHSPEAIVELTDAPGEILGSAEVVEWLFERAEIGLTASQLGVLERALELVSTYAREREQFGKPIGTFQAVTQRLADAYIDVKGVRLSLIQAAWRIAEGLPAAAEIHTAKFWAADAGHRVAHTVIHVHGGVGLDTDHPVHRYFLAAKHHEFALGAATDQLRRLGAILAATPA